MTAADLHSGRVFGKLVLQLLQLGLQVLQVLPVLDVLALKLLELLVGPLQFLGHTAMVSAHVLEPVSSSCASAYLLFTRFCSVVLLSDQSTFCTDPLHF